MLVEQKAPNFKFSSTVNLEKILLPSGTCEIPDSTIFDGPIPSISLPKNFIEPDLILIIPEIAINIVLLPAPFAPIKVTISPFLTSKLIPFIAFI
ncbi:hypothetical protein ES708_27826 [subsurface metagenome]